MFPPFWIQILLMILLPSNVSATDDVLSNPLLDNPVSTTTTLDNNNNSSSNNNNNNSNSSSTNKDYKPNTTEATLFYEIASYINLVTVTLGAIGNGFVLVASTKTWNISIHYKLTAALGLSDLIFAVLNFFYLIQYMLNLVYHRITCKIFNPVMSTTIYLDIGFIVIIALERFAAICYPLKGGFSVNTVAGLSIFNLFFALFSAFPLTMVTTDSGRGCKEEWSGAYAKMYTIYLLVVYFLIPVSLIGGLYYKSITTLNQVSHSLTCSNDAARSRKNEENRRILFILCCLVTAFFVLVLPSWLCFFILDYTQVTEKWNDVMNGLSSLTFPMHTLCNPIIYSLVDRKVRLILFGAKKKRGNSTTAYHMTRTTNM